MAIEETGGGLLGVLALDVLIIKLGLPLLIIGGIIIGIFHLLALTAEDFVQAKADNKSIMCFGLFKHYEVTPDSYFIDVDKKEIKLKTHFLARHIDFAAKKFKIGDCDIID